MTSLASLEACKVAISSLDLSMCKPFGFDASTWIAIITPLATGIFFVGKALIARLRNTPSGNYIYRSLTRGRFKNLCRKIKPLVDDNRRIFITFGPNSGATGAIKLVRDDLGIWYKLRKKVSANNTRIRSLVSSNLDSVPSQYRDLFVRWINHIDAFEAHVADPTADYRHHQFPIEIDAIVRQHA